MNSKLLYFSLSSFLFSSMLFSTEISISLNGSPVSDSTKVPLGNKIEVTVTGKDFVKLSIDQLDQSEGVQYGDWSKKTVTKSKTVNAFNMKLGYLAICWQAKDDDQVFATATADYDSLECKYIDVDKPVKLPGKHAGKIDSILISQNGKAITRDVKVNIGDKIIVTATSDEWLQMEADDTDQNDRTSMEWMKNSATAVKTVRKEDTDKGFIRFCIYAKDNEDMANKTENTHYDISDCFSLNTIDKTYLADTTPGTVDGVKIKVLNPKLPIKKEMSEFKKGAASQK